MKQLRQGDVLLEQVDSIPDDAVEVPKENGIEHSTIDIPPGNWRVVRQREYSPKEIRNVQD